MTNVFCDTATLRDALKRISAAVISKRKLSAQCYSYAHVTVANGALKLAGTDLDCWGYTTVECRSDGEVQIGLEAAFLGALLNKLPSGEVLLRIDGEASCTLESGKSKYTVPALKYSELPVINEDFPATATSLPTPALREIFRLTRFAAHTDATRSIMCGVHLKITPEGIQATATDTHRLSRVTAGIEGLVEQTAIVPPAAIDGILSMFTDEAVLADFQESKICFASQDRREFFASRLFDGQFPNCDKVIPTVFDREFRLNRDEMKNALARTALLHTGSIYVDGAYRTVLTFSDGSVTMVAGDRSGSAQKGEEIIDADVTKGDGELKVVMNSGYLSQLLSILQCDTIVMRARGPLNPLAFYEDGSEAFLHILMPQAL